MQLSGTVSGLLFPLSQQLSKIHSPQLQMLTIIIMMTALLGILFLGSWLAVATIFFLYAAIGCMAEQIKEMCSLEYVVD